MCVCVFITEVAHGDPGTLMCSDFKSFLEKKNINMSVSMTFAVFISMGNKQNRKE